MSTVKENLIYLFHIDLKNKKQLYLTSSNDNIVYEGRKYLPYSGLNLLSGKFNDSAENHILLHGIFDSLGITKEDEIKGSSIKIIYSIRALYRHFVTYICTEYQVYDLEFKIKCEPEAIKYNQSLLQVFSKTCRANFGDTKCKINISDYEVACRLLGFKGNILTCDIEGYDDGYFQNGNLITKKQDSEEEYKFEIISHRGNNIEIINRIKFNFTQHQEIILIPSCDKNFRTCCDYFNNAVNFRGEPHIPEYDIIKV
ncbi:phage BR0599 family protein [Rickettsiaceae bacterium]|nr:phage BR0599 family protein [Rickettsiaceae bacterium]